MLSCNIKFPILRCLDSELLFLHTHSFQNVFSTVLTLCLSLPTNAAVCLSKTHVVDGDGVLLTNPTTVNGLSRPRFFPRASLNVCSANTFPHLGICPTLEHSQRPPERGQTGGLSTNQASGI